MHAKEFFSAVLLLWLATVAPSFAEGSLDITPKISESVGAADGKKFRLYSASKALVIGIDKYENMKFGAKQPWPKLSKAIEDAQEVAKALEEQGFKVTLKTNLGSVELETVFRDFFLTEGADPEARLLVWFAGHGHTIDGEGYLVPADAPSDRPSNVEFRRSALSLRRFGEYMREARAKHVLAIFDSCFAGTVFNVARSAPPPAITYSTALQVRQFISSGEAEQLVSDDGMFRKLFVDALRGLEPGADANGDGFITGSELGQFLFDKVTNFSNRRQTPRYGKLNAYGFDRGDFVLERRKLEFVQPPSSAVPPAAIVPAPEPTVSNDTTFAKALQSELRRLQCYEDEPDGQWGLKSTNSLSRARLKLSLADDGRVPNSLDLAALKRASAPLCPPTCASGFEVKGSSCVPLPCPGKAKRNSDGDCVAAPPAPEVIVKKKQEKAQQPPVDTTTKEKAAKSPTKERESLPWCTVSYTGVDRCRRRDSGEVCDRFGSGGWRCKPG